MRIMRARFSALIPRELQRAMQQLVPPNAADAAAVDARQEIDLRVGASFTRMQTLLLQVGGFPCCCGLLHVQCLSRRARAACNCLTPSLNTGALFLASNITPNAVLSLACMVGVEPTYLLCVTCCVQSKFDWPAGGVDNDRPMLSYGPCQFPTLGLIVQRAW